MTFPQNVYGMQVSMQKILPGLNSTTQKVLLMRWTMLLKADLRNIQGSQSGLCRMRTVKLISRAGGMISTGQCGEIKHQQTAVIIVLPILQLTAGAVRSLKKEDYH